VTFGELVTEKCGVALRARTLGVVQVNVGKRCNQRCAHCHVDAGPERTEVMSDETLADVFALIDRTPTVHTVDVTGGAPELHPRFRWIVDEATRRGRRVIDRCNLTILATAPFAELPAFLAERGVEVVASLPHPRQTLTDRQRGDGVFARSIEGMRRLNAVGYGAGDPGKRLVLVSNPVGAFLPASQASLEREWKAELAARHGVSFDALICLTNMPVGRYRDWLVASGNHDRYLARLEAQFNPTTVTNLMCRDQVSIAWNGFVYDCDFNQMADVAPIDGALHVRDLDPARFSERVIATAPHCYGCTAGAGSSCGGALA
jgi:radical SAM/Cys-rich protein